MLSSHIYIISLIITTILHVGTFFFRWNTWGFKKLSQLSVVTNVIIDRARVQTQVYLNSKPRYWIPKQCWLLNFITNEINMCYGCSWDSCTTCDGIFSITYLLFICLCYCWGCIASSVKSIDIHICQVPFLLASWRLRLNEFYLIDVIVF